MSKKKDIKAMILKAIESYEIKSAEYEYHKWYNMGLSDAKKAVKRIIK